MKEHIRRCYFRPYGKGKGPTFRLDLYDTGAMLDLYHSRVAYELRQVESYSTNGRSRRDGRLIFSGADYGCPTHQAIDSDHCVEGIMGFLTLRPGDTDSDYFAGYTPEQVEFAETHAEALSLEVMNRFCNITKEADNDSP